MGTYAIATPAALGDDCRSRAAATALRNRQALLKARPDGIQQAEHFWIVEGLLGESGVGFNNVLASV